MVLNSVPVSGATSDDNWTKLISDYFTAVVGDSGAETVSGSPFEFDLDSLHDW